MKKIIHINIIMLLLAAATLAAKAQKTKSTNNAIDTATKPRKPTKAETDTDNYIKMAEGVKGRFRSLFPSKPGDTVYVVIPGITYLDPNLKLLKEKIDDVKSTKGLTSSYKNNTAIVKVLYKGGDASKLYDNLSDDLKELFAPQDIEGCRLILNYKLATPKE